MLLLYLFNRIKYATKRTDMDFGNLNRVSRETAPRLWVNSAELPMCTISEHVPRVWKATHVTLYFALNVTQSRNDRSECQLVATANKLIRHLKIEVKVNFNL